MRKISILKFKIEDIINKNIVNGENRENIDFAKRSLSLIYPEPLIKRFIFRPIRGKWFPFIDINIRGYNSQHSLFFGVLCVSFSNVRRCLNCDKEIKNNYTEIYGFALSLCKECKFKIYYNYWDCLYSVIISNILNRKKTKERERFDKIEKFPICNDFINARCGYPVNFVNINPCLKNHAIGLILKQNLTIEIIIGQLNKIKYQMIRNGGLIGLVIGYKNRIMNLEVLYEKLPLFFQVLEKVKRDFNKQLKQTTFTEKNYSMLNESKNDLIFKKNKMRIIYPFSGKIYNIDAKAVYHWIFIHFLNYYENYNIKRIIKEYFKDFIVFLRTLLSKFEKTLDFDQLELVELYKKFPPFCENIREKLESELKNKFNLKNITDLRVDLSKINFRESLREITFEKIIEKFRRIKLLDLNNHNQNLEIYEINGALGRYLIARTNVSMENVIICLDDLIGRSTN